MNYLFPYLINHHHRNMIFLLRHWRATTAQKSLRQVTIDEHIPRPSNLSGNPFLFYDWINLSAISSKDSREVA